MKDKLFFCIVYIVISLGTVQVSLSYADVVDPGVHEAAVQDKLIPDHKIKYKGPLSPDWKTNWDLARSLYRDKKYQKALVQYEILFTQKENIEEARWEYVSILMYLKRWEKAKGGLEKLLATEPESVRYRLAMATVNLKTGSIDQAISLFTQLHAQPITEAETVMVLEGLIKAHEQKGQKNEAAVLLVELVSMKPQDYGLQRKLATLELERGNIDKAKELCDNLEQALPEDVAVLVLQAHVEERLDNNDDAAKYWQMIIALDPYNAEAHSHLSAYYFAKNNWPMSLRHLEPLIKITPNDISLLERAAELNMRLNRIDRALKYYEYGLAVDPLNKEVLEGKKRAQRILAKDLLALVENKGGKKLWQDLVNVAPDSAGVYREIAQFLREQGEVDELIEVLTLLNKQAPGEQKIYEELASLLKQQGRVEELSALQASKSDLNKNKPKYN